MAKGEKKSKGKAKDPEESVAIKKSKKDKTKGEGDNKKGNKDKAKLESSTSEQKKGKDKSKVEGTQSEHKKGGKDKSKDESGKRKTMSGNRNSQEKGHHGDKKRTKSAESPPPAEHPPTPPTEPVESFKCMGTIPEWNSAEVKSHELTTEEFTYYIVLVMEDSVNLTPMSNYLHLAVKTGVRSQFVTIGAEDIAVKVRKCLAVSRKNSKTEPPPNDDQTVEERMDVWAEALKHQLIEVKTSKRTKLKEIELKGARSKDLVTEFCSNLPLPPPPPPPPPPEEPIVETQDAVKDTLPVPPPVETPKPPKKRKSRKSKDGSRRSKSKSKDRGASRVSNIVKVKIRSLYMKKRGELPMPRLEEVDDAPTNGLHNYILLQGFYDPKILEQLQLIGVNVEGILLMTEEDVGLAKRNCNLIEYLKHREQNSTTNTSDDKKDVVDQFWHGLSDICNKASADSPLKECVFGNCVLPPKDEKGLVTPEARGVYALNLFNEATQRVYEMVALSGWVNE